MDDEARKARAETRRRTTTLNRTTLSRFERDLDPTFADAAISLVERLTREGWAEAGKGIATYRRSEIPIRFVKGRLT